MMSVDKSRLSGVKVLQTAKLHQVQFEDLARKITDTICRKNKELFVFDKSTKPALYLVREGRFQIRYPSGVEKIIEEGGYFGEDQLLVDAERSSSKNPSPRVKPQYTVTALEDKSICGVLRLVDCRKIFDTTTLELPKERNELGKEKDGDTMRSEKQQKMMKGMSRDEGRIVEDDSEDAPPGLILEDPEDDFGGIVGRRSSRRSSVDMNKLRDSLERKSVLGEGQFGEVWEVNLSQSLDELMVDDSDAQPQAQPENFALQIQSKSAVRSKTSAMEAIERECKVLSSLDHPYIVDLVHAYEDEENHYRFTKYDWHDFYRGAKEAIPTNAPEARGESVSIHCFVDANLAGDTATRRSQTGILIFVNRAPIVWYSKRQSTVEASTFGSEIIAMKTAIEMIEGLRYKLRMFGIPIDGPQAVTMNCSIPDSTLKKKHHSIAYHRNREAVAAGTVRIAKEDTETNLADVLGVIAREAKFNRFMY